MVLDWMLGKVVLLPRSGCRDAVDRGGASRGIVDVREDDVGARSKRRGAPPPWNVKLEIDGMVALSTWRVALAARGPVACGDRGAERYVPSGRTIVSTSKAKSGGVAGVDDAGKLVVPEASVTLATPVVARAVTSNRTVPATNSLGMYPSGPTIATAAFCVLVPAMHFP
jgi:hypothetical protein